VITGFAHICFIVRDLEASIAFYSGKLGFKHGFDFINDKGEKFGVYLHIGGRCFIELFQGQVAERAEKQSYQHFCLEVDDIESTVTALREKGVELTPVKMGSDNSWQSWLKDPDGNRIELHHYTPKSKQQPSLKP
jgi:catechol 2,3-dioxygenase-like lactoylglutathione lyase family enzyme